MSRYSFRPVWLNFEISMKSSIVCLVCAVLIFPCKQTFSCSAVIIPYSEYPAYACFDKGFIAIDEGFEACVLEHLKNPLPREQFLRLYDPCNDNVEGELRELKFWSKEDRERFEAILASFE